MASDSCAAIPISVFGSDTEMLESSIAIAGASTDRNSRTATPDETPGEPENRCANSACSKSARRWLASVYGRCASSQSKRPVDDERKGVTIPSRAPAVSVTGNVGGMGVTKLYEYVRAVPIVPVEETWKLIKIASR